jgi:hypothetical protein
MVALFSTPRQLVKLFRPAFLLQQRRVLLESARESSKGGERYSPVRMGKARRGQGMD